MSQRFHAIIYTLLIIALVGMTATAAFLFGQLQQESGNQNSNSINLNQPQLNNNGGNANTNQTPAGTSPKVDLTNHDTYLTFSSDPTAFSEGELIAESASVPDVLVCDPEITTSACEASEFLVYFVNTAGFKNPGDESIALIRSTDQGQTWSEREGVQIEGLADGLGAVDPSVVMLSDGRLRLYFFGSTITQGDPASGAGDHNIYSAVSSDGTHFTLEEEVRLAREKITDPEVVAWNGSWYMLYSEGPNSGLAVSSDGLTFEDKGLISPSFGGVPGLVVTEDGLLGYGCQQGIASALSTDGETFTKNSSLALSVSDGVLCDPSVSPYEDQFVMVYKTAPASSLQNGQKLPPLNSNLQQ